MGDLERMYVETQLRNFFSMTEDRLLEREVEIKKKKVFIFLFF